MLFVGAKVTPGPCSSEEVHATLNYQDVIQGTSYLAIWQIDDNGRPMNEDVTPALQGSNSYLPLTSEDSDHQKPVRLLIRRSPESSLWQMGFISVSFSVIHVRQVHIEVYDELAQVAAQHAVR